MDGSDGMGWGCDAMDGVASTPSPFDFALAFKCNQSQRRWTQQKGGETGLRQGFFITGRLSVSAFGWVHALIFQLLQVSRWARAQRSARGGQWGNTLKSQVSSPRLLIRLKSKVFLCCQATRAPRADTIINDGVSFRWIEGCR